MTLEKNKGQVAVEYVLLLVIVITLAGIFKSFIDVGTQGDRNSAAPFVQYWRTLVEKIGEDVPHP